MGYERGLREGVWNVDLLKGLGDGEVLIWDDRNDDLDNRRVEEL